MDKYVYSEANQHTMILRQLGADVTVITSSMVFVKYTLECGVELSYVYNINKKGKYFLQRINPYPIDIEQFNNANDVINNIKLDIAQFENASKSHNLETFLKIQQHAHNLIQYIEDLFLYYNVKEEDINNLYNDIRHARATINDAMDSSERVWLSKDPFHLKPSPEAIKYKNK